MSEVTLSPAELVRITGFRQPGRQLAALLALGFYRARRSRVTGEVILERPHYDAVCAGVTETARQQQAHRPQVRPPRLRAVT